MEVLKRSFGAWMLPVFRTLAALRGLRGTLLDPFAVLAGRAARERARWWSSYCESARRAPARRADERAIGSAVAVAALPEKISRLRHVKVRGIAEYRRTCPCCWRRTMHRAARGAAARAGRPPGDRGAPAMPIALDCRYRPGVRAGSPGRSAWSTSTT